VHEFFIVFKVHQSWRVLEIGTFCESGSVVKIFFLQVRSQTGINRSGLQGHKFLQQEMEKNINDSPETKVDKGSVQDLVGVSRKINPTAEIWICKIRM